MTTLLTAPLAALGTALVALGTALGWLLRVLIRVYQLCLSSVLPPSCRFTPTCSDYACQAIARHGPLSGTGLALLRVLRCNPWNRGGDDPLPTQLPSLWPKRHSHDCRHAVQDQGLADRG